MVGDKLTAREVGLRRERLDESSPWLTMDEAKHHIRRPPSQVWGVGRISIYRLGVVILLVLAPNEQGPCYLGLAATNIALVQNAEE